MIEEEEQKEEVKDQTEHQKDLEKISNKAVYSKEYTEILSSVIHEGEEIFKKKPRAIFLSSCIAGLEIGFSYVLVCTMFFLLHGMIPDHFVYRLFGLVYPFGFVLVILGKSALFTEQTSVLALPVLNRQRSILQLLKIWGIVIVGNVLGGNLFVLFISELAPDLGLFDDNTMVTVGTHIWDNAPLTLFLSAVAAGWLMGLLTWLLNSTIQALTRILIIVMVTGAIGFAGFHHSIVGNLEVFGAFIHSDSISILDYLLFLFITMLGNGFGGAIVVGLFKYRIFESNYSSKGSHNSNWE